MKTKLFLLAILLVAGQRVQAQNPVQPFRIVGYYSLRAAMGKEATSIPLKRLTHVNLWFLNPDTTGNFTQDYSSLRPFIQAAHNKKVKVLFSIAGGSPHPYYHKLLKDDRRGEFISKLVALVTTYDLDGIDVDLEGGDIDDNYEKFVVELAQALRTEKKLITAAVAVYYKDQLTDRALDQYDFMNVMSYDRTGPWRPEKPGPHSTLAHAQEDLAYFANVRKVAKERMTLGVPFYGYGFGPELTSPAISMNFQKIVSTYRGSEKVDEWKMPDGKILYYNGIPTMKAKTTLAKEQASGIMIWEIRGDAKGSLSLLKTINKLKARD